MERRVSHASGPLAPRLLDRAAGVGLVPPSASAGPLTRAGALQTYKRPRRPFEKERLDAEMKLLGEYGLRGKREIWRVQMSLSKCVAAHAPGRRASGGAGAEAPGAGG